MLTIIRFISSLAVLLWSSLSFAQTLSLTFDDGLNPDTQAQAEVWNQQIIASLKDAGITAMVFPSLARIGGDRGMNLIMDWAQAGHAVGNHTATHRSLAAKDMTLADFILDVKKADAALHHFPTWVPMLRFPYLKEGDTLEKRDGFRSWMKANRYRPAPVSIDASDWYYNQVYSTLLRAGSQEKAARVKAAYIEHLLDRASYYDGLAKRVLGRSPSHVILLHTSEINAATLSEIIAAFRKRGWAFVPPMAAFDDPVYASPPDTLPAGESVIWANAKVHGVAGLRYPAEDSVYEEPKLRSAGLLP
ncbi:MAG: polysaccharide deacetylase family protein [Ottowia sp.]|uniref:polysaccharide deacetylase family protein n=1 Tax=Ottowia sp. TaxID=1898956 RepID=UPI003C72B438